VGKLLIGIVGFGVIGQRWAAAFSHAGHDVRAYDPSGRDAAFRETLPQLMADLDALAGPSAAPGAIELFPTMAEALSGVGFVQESGPEDIAVKRRLLAEIESHVSDRTVIASSSSALIVSEMQTECRFPGRIVLGHPFNPAHIMPLVEIVGGKATDPQALATARAVYEALVRDGVASVEDVDRAFMYGPGPKWALQGSFISNQLNAAGMEDFLRKYGPTYQAIWDTLLDARLDAPTIHALTTSTAEAVAGRTQDSLREARETGLVEILRTVNRHGAY
jgi:3-hydroxyacyl-CoA dehydrogenase